MNMMPLERPPVVEEASLGRYLGVLRDRKWWIIASVVLLVAVAGWRSLVVAVPTYNATSSILRQNSSLDQALFDTQIFKLRDPQRDLQTGSQLIKVGTVAEMVKKDLGSPRSVGQLRGMVMATPNLDTDIIGITAFSTDPAEAAAVANSFATQFILYRQAADRAALAQARVRVEQELAGMTEAERASQRGVVLSQKSEELGILESMQTGGFEVVQVAGVPGSPSSPRPVRSAILALAAGLFMGGLLAFGVDFLDRRIKTTDTLEKEFGLPVLATIPRIPRIRVPEVNAPSNGAVGFSDQSPHFVESFRTLRSNLKYFEFDRQIRTIAITSGLPGEGKTLTTVNLAVSLALSGARVAVIEADLRRPMLHRYLRLSNGAGVSNVLAGAHTLGQVMQRARIDQQGVVNFRSEQDPSRRLERNLLCLTSGPLPPNPAELIGSQQMKTLIDDVAALADYVLIDTPPVLVVADALSLVALVDAVIVCARLNSSKIDEAREARTLLQRTGAHTLGLVAGGRRERGRRHRDRYGYYVSERTIEQSAAAGGQPGRPIQPSRSV